MKIESIVLETINYLYRSLNKKDLEETRKLIKIALNKLENIDFNNFCLEDIAGALFI